MRILLFVCGSFLSVNVWALDHLTPGTPIKILNQQDACAKGSLDAGCFQAKAFPGIAKRKLDYPTQYAMVVGYGIVQRQLEAGKVLTEEDWGHVRFVMNRVQERGRMARDQALRSDVTLAYEKTSPAWDLAKDLAEQDPTHVGKILSIVGDAAIKQISRDLGPLAQMSAQTQQYSILEHLRKKGDRLTELQFRAQGDPTLAKAFDTFLGEQLGTSIGDVTPLLETNALNKGVQKILKEHPKNQPKLSEQEATTMANAIKEGVDELKEKRKDAAREQLAEQINDFRLGLQIVNDLAPLIRDPELQKTVKAGVVVTDGFLKLYSAFNVKDISKLALSANMVGIAMEVFNYFSAGPSTDQMILQELADLRAEMKAEFDSIRESLSAIDAKISKLRDDVIANFDALSRQQQLDSTRLKDMQKQLAEIQAQLHAIEFSLYDHFNAAGWNQLSADTAHTRDETRKVYPLGNASRANLEEAFSRTASYAFEARVPPLPNTAPVLDPNRLFNVAKEEFGAGDLLSFTRAAPTGDGSNLANFLNWRQGAERYLELLEHPLGHEVASPAHLDHFEAAASDLEAFVDKVRDPAFLRLLLGHQRAAAARVTEAIKQYELAFLHARRLDYTLVDEQKKPKQVGIDFWNPEKIDDTTYENSFPEIATADGSVKNTAVDAMPNLKFPPPLVAKLPARSKLFLQMAMSEKGVKFASYWVPQGESFLYQPGNVYVGMKTDEYDGTVQVPASGASEHKKDTVAVHDTWYRAAFRVLIKMEIAGIPLYWGRADTEPTFVHFQKNEAGRLSQNQWLQNNAQLLQNNWAQGTEMSKNIEWITMDKGHLDIAIQKAYADSATAIAQRKHALQNEFLGKLNALLEDPTSDQAVLLPADCWYLLSNSEAYQQLKAALGEHKKALEIALQDLQNTERQIAAFLQLGFGQYEELHKCDDSPSFEDAPGLHALDSLRTQYAQLQEEVAKAPLKQSPHDQVLSDYLASSREIESRLSQTEMPPHSTLPAIDSLRARLKYARESLGTRRP